MTIKKISLLVATLLLSATSYCQYSNSLSLALQTSNMGLGARYEHRFQKFGVYTMGTYGRYNDNPSYIDTELSLSAGILLPEKHISPDWYACFLIGACHGTYTFDEYLLPPLSGRASDPWSMEIGVTGQIHRVNVFCSADVSKWKMTVGLGWCF